MIDIETLNKAIALTQQGHIEQAESLFFKLLKEDPQDSILLSSIGLFYVSIKNYDKAHNYLEKACEIQESAGTVSALGFCEFEQKNYDKAIGTLERALNYGDNANIYDKLILSCFHCGNLAKAIEYSGKMFEKYPQNTDAIAHMVKALTHSGALAEAENLCIETLKKNPNAIPLWFHLGFLKELIYCDDKQAIRCYKQALNLGANSAHINIGVSYSKLNNKEKAEEHYKKMLEFYPQDTDTLTSLGMCYLSQKKFKEGYDLFFNRKRYSIENNFKNFWKPNDKFEDEIIVLCDQGFGDHIQFARYLPLLQKRVKKIHVIIKENLKPLFEYNFPNIDFISNQEINFDLQYLRITDLAYALGIDFDNIPLADGYLDVPKTEIYFNKPKIGICWEAGSAGIRTMINRTINVKLFEPFFNLENIQTFSFQVKDTLKGNEKYTQMINLAKDFKNFYDTACALKSMDAVVTVDTSIAHLAGALGVKTFLLLPYASDWRWFDNNKTTEWYKSVEIFKQTDPISWEKPIEDIVCKLKEFYS